MLPGFALEQTWTGTPDFPGHEVVTMSPGGPGRMVPCLKCNQCGHSETGHGHDFMTRKIRGAGPETVEPCTQEDRDRIRAAAHERAERLRWSANDLDVIASRTLAGTGDILRGIAAELRQLAGATE